LSGFCSGNERGSLILKDMLNVTLGLHPPVGELKEFGGRGVLGVRTHGEKSERGGKKTKIVRRRRRRGRIGAERDRVEGTFQPEKTGQEDAGRRGRRGAGKKVTAAARVSGRRPERPGGLFEKWNFRCSWGRSPRSTERREATSPGSRRPSPSTPTKGNPTREDCTVEGWVSAQMGSVLSGGLELRAGRKSGLWGG